MSAALIVEDDESLARLICHTLEREGIIAQCVNTAEEAVIELAQRRFHYALVDIMLPGSSGFYVIETVRRMSPETRPVTIVVTATRSAILDKIDRSVVKAVMFKPLQIDALAAFLRTWKGD